MIHLKTKLVFAICILLSLGNGFAQSLQHPIIWVHPTDRATILENIQNYDWASSLNAQLHSRNDAKVNTHVSTPSAILGSISPMPGNRSSHRDVLTSAVESGILYFLTEEDKYAQYCADILSDYTKKLATVSPANINFYNGYLIESREVYPKIGLIYDFVYHFLETEGTTIFDNETETRKPFNHDAAQAAIKNLIDAINFRGLINSNHPVLEATGALYNILCLTDDTERQSYFNTFMNGASRQNGLSWMLGHLSPEEGLWPETITYGKGPQRIIMMLMNIVDRYQPNLKVIDNNLQVLEGSFAYENFKYPNNSAIMAYGDSRRHNDETESLYENVATIANRKAYPQLERNSLVLLKKLYAEAGGYDPKIETDPLEYHSPLRLLWGVNVSDTITAKEIIYNTTATASHAGVVMQRNYFGSNREENSLMCYAGGAEYVHSHLSGLDMELYGVGYVMGAVAADIDDRDSDINRHYYRIYAGHNTVIVNGKSQGSDQGSWKSDGMLFMNTTKLKASEPLPSEAPISTNFSFTTQLLEDRINNCDQQRTLSIIRTSGKSGYYLDIFRSKSLGTNDFHDYVYHNIGDAMQLTNNTSQGLALTPQPDRYPSFTVQKSGYTMKFPGWHYFEDVKTSAATTKTVLGRFDVNKNNSYMHFAMPNGVTREYSSTLGPPTLEAEGGYDQKKVQILSIRQQGEAWNKPFIVVYEPSKNSEATIQNVESLFSGDQIVGAKVTSKIQNREIGDYIISHDGPSGSFSLPEISLQFEGRFAIVRKATQDEQEQTSLYIGEGTQLSFGDLSLNGNDKNQGLLVVGHLDSIADVPNETGSSIVIEAEDYDQGGAEVAYHDFDEGNSGGAYRTDDVDIVAVGSASNGYSITQFKGGDWMNYTFEVLTSGMYQMDYIAANQNRGDAIVDIYLDNVLLFDNALVTRTFNWEVFKSTTMPEAFMLEKGIHTLKIEQALSLSHNPDAIILRRLIESNTTPNASEIEYKIYPNPASDYIKIELGDKKSDIKIFNILGIKIYELRNVNNTITIPTHQLGGKGMFVILINSQAFKVQITAP